MQEFFFFNKVAGLRPATLLKKRIWQGCFPVNFVKFLRKLFLIEHLWWLLQKYTENTVRHLYFTEESDYSKENTCGNEVFRSTIERN